MGTQTMIAPLLAGILTVAGASAGGPAGKPPVQEVLREPSGLVATPLRAGDGRRIVAAIDDELGEIWMFVADPNTPGKVTKRGVIPLATPVEDFEALAFDARPGVGRILAVTSHRRYDEPAEAVIVRRALAADSREEQLRLPPVEIARAMLALGVPAEITKRDRIRIGGEPWWKKRDNARHPYAFEFEAATCVGDELLLGVKHPQGPDGQALVLRVPIDAIGAETPPVIEGFTLDLGGAGATGMCVDPATGDLLVASNPSVKVGAGGATAEDVFGRSFLHRFRLTDQGAVMVAERVALGRPDAKLEGVAVVDDEIWLAYDGQTSAILRVPRDELIDVTR